MAADKSTGKNESRALQDQIQTLTERMFHVDYRLHQIQNKLLETVSTVEKQGKQLNQLDVLRLQMETTDMKLSSLKDGSDKVLGMEKQLKDHAEQLKQLERMETNETEASSLKYDSDKVLEMEKQLEEHALQLKQLQRFDAIELQVDTLQRHLDADAFSSNKTVHMDSEIHYTENSQEHAPLKQHEPDTSTLDELRARLEKLESGFEPNPDIDISTIANFASHPDYRKCEYVLQESVWDIAILIGSGVFEAGASVVIFILYILNAMMQITFLIICGFFFVDPDINEDTVEAARIFRMLDAHHDNWLAYGSSLAQRLCLPDLQPPDPIALVVGGYQNAQLSDFDEYLKTDASDAIERLFNGEMMCILATACWIISVMSEMNICLDAMFTIGSMGTVKRTLIMLHSDGSLTLDALSLSRKAFALLFLTVRFGIVCALTVFGCLWLGGTEAITDLLLNTVALGFILSIDEMLYAGLVDERTKEKMKCFAPLKKAEWPSYKGWEVKSTFFNILGPVGVVIAFLLCNVPLTENMKAVSIEMCRGHLNFTYSHDALTRVLISSIQKDTGASYDENLTEMSVLDKIAGTVRGPSDEWTLYVDPANVGYSVRSTKHIPLSQLVDDVNPSCSDLFAPSEESAIALQYRSILKQQLDEWVMDCAEIEDYCLSSAFKGTIVRAICSETCKCNTPFSLVGSHKSSYGCPDSCVAGQKYQKELLSASCSDITLYDLQQQTSWKAWVNYLGSRILWDEVKGIGDVMMQHGCDFYHHMPWSRLTPRQLLTLACRGELPRRMRPIAIACPVTCGCTHASKVLHGEGICAYGNHNCANSTSMTSLPAIGG